MANRGVKLNVGDVVEHEEFGRGTVERLMSGSAVLFSVIFEEGPKIIRQDSTNIIKVNDSRRDAVLRRQILEEAYEASNYLRYTESIHGLPFSETEYPDFVKALDEWCIKRGTMKIGCNPSYETRAIQRLTAASVPELTRYLHIGQNQEDGEEGHGMWVNIFIPDPKIADIDKLLHVFFNPRALTNKGVYMLAKLQYTVRLLGKMAMDARPEDEGQEPLVLG